MICRPLRVLAVVAAVLGAIPAGAVAQQTPIQVRLLTEGQPPGLSFQLFSGSITIRGSNRRDMLVSARGQSGPPMGGLRQLAAAAFSIEQERNRVTIVPEKGRAIDFEIEVPSRTNLKLNLHTGPIVVEGVEGELEIDNANGSITLNRVGGAIVAHSTNHHVKATVTSVSAERPTAFSSLNGRVDVTFPASLKANLKIVANKGSVFTDFDLTPVPSAEGPPTFRKEGAGLRLDVKSDIYGAVNGGGPEIELRSFNGNIYVRRGQ